MHTRCHTHVGQRTEVLLFHHIDSRDQIHIISQTGQHTPSLIEFFYQLHVFTGAFPVYVGKESWDVMEAQFIVLFKTKYEFSVLDKNIYRCILIMLSSSSNLLISSPPSYPPNFMFFLPISYKKNRKNIKETNRFHKPTKMKANWQKTFFQRRVSLIGMSTLISQLPYFSAPWLLLTSWLHESLITLSFTGLLS